MLIAVLCDVHGKRAHARKAAPDAAIDSAQREYAALADSGRAYAEVRSAHGWLPTL